MKLTPLEIEYFIKACYYRDYMEIYEYDDNDNESIDENYIDEIKELLTEEVFNTISTDEIQDKIIEYFDSKYDYIETNTIYYDLEKAYETNLTIFKVKETGTIFGFEWNESNYCNLDIDGDCSEMIEEEVTKIEYKYVH